MSKNRIWPALGERMKKARTVGDVVATTRKICESLPPVCPLCGTSLDPNDVVPAVDASGETDDEFIARLKGNCPQCKGKS